MKGHIGALTTPCLSRVMGAAHPWEPGFTSALFRSGDQFQRSVADMPSESAALTGISRGVRWHTATVPGTTAIA